MGTERPRLYHATLADLDFLYRVIVADARAGHFDLRLAEPAQAALLRRNLASIIVNLKRLDEPLMAQAIVYRRGSERIGCVINSEIIGGAGNELWMIAIDPDHRGRGHGARMVDAVIERLRPVVPVYARCAPASEQMYEMFIRRGFERIETTPGGYRVLRLGTPPGGGQNDTETLAPFHILSLSEDD